MYDCINLCDIICQTTAHDICFCCLTNIINVSFRNMEYMLKKKTYTVNKDPPRKTSTEVHTETNLQDPQKVSCFSADNVQKCDSNLDKIVPVKKEYSKLSKESPSEDNQKESKLNFSLPDQVPASDEAVTESKNDPSKDRIQYRYKHGIKEKHSRMVGNGIPQVYQVELNEIFSSETDNIRKLEFGKTIKNRVSEKVLMLVGATGSGKTTLINGIFNYIVGVKWDDPFRFRLVDEVDQVKGKTQGDSQTSWITSYTIHQHFYCSAVPFTLTIIDTPGFGDTKGIKRDKEITEQIRKFFSTIGDFGIDHIDAIGLVVQAALPRLTNTQKYLFDSILTLFGKDIKDNIFMLLTFADGQKPETLAALEFANIPYKLHLKFNNSALFASTSSIDCDSDDEEGNFDEMFWKMSNRSYKKFLLSHLEMVEPKSLVLTKIVLEKRSQLETLIKGIQVDIQRGLIKCEEVTRELKVMQEHQKDIESNTDFTYTVKVESWDKISSEFNSVNCNSCETTCHSPCGHLMVATCSTIHWFYCTNCGCGIGKHSRSKEKFELVPMLIQKTKDDMLQKYKNAEGGNIPALEMKKKAEKKLRKIQDKLLGLTESASQALQELNKIALKPNPLSTCDYIDLLIETEKQECKEGWKEHLEQLIEIRKQAENTKDPTYNRIDHFKDYESPIQDDKNNDCCLAPEDEKENMKLKTMFSFRLKFK